MAAIIPQISNKCFTARCVCSDSKRCAQISRSFRNLKDLRSSFVQFPMSNGSQRYNAQNAIKSKKAKCFTSYLGFTNPLEPRTKNGSTYLIVDRRNRKKKAQDDTNCVNPIGIMRKRVFVALHHFHPRIIDPTYGITKVQCNGGRFKLPDLVPISKLESGDLMEYYSPSDRYDQHRSLIVPNYPLSKSEEDLTLLYSSIHKVLPHNSTSSLKSSLAPSKRSREDEAMTPDLYARSKLESGDLMEYYPSDDCHDKYGSLIVPSCPLSQSEDDLTHLYSSIQRVLPHNSITSLKSSLTPSTRSWTDEELILIQSAKRLKSCNNNKENVEDVSIRRELKLMNDIERDTFEALESRRPRNYAMNAYRPNLLQSCHMDPLSYKTTLSSDLAIRATLTDISLSKARLVNNLQKQLSDVRRDRLLMELSFLMRNNPIANTVDYSLL